MKKYSLIIIAIISGLLAGVASGYYTGKKYTQEIVTVDVKKIVEEKRMELIKKFQTEKIDKTTPDENISIVTKDLQKEYVDFLTKLDLILDAYLKGHKNTLLIRKEAIIDGKYADITIAVKDKVNALVKEKTNDQTPTH